MEKELSKFQFRGCKITRTLMEIADSASLDMNMKVSFNVSDSLEPKDGFLQFPMGVVISNSTKTISIEVDVVGTFLFMEDIRIPDIFSKVSAPAILFPYIRSYVTAMTSLAGIRPIVLPTFNMTREK